MRSRGSDQHATCHKICGTCHKIRGTYHKIRSTYHKIRDTYHKISGTFLLSLFFTILELKLFSKIFGNSCLFDLRIEASLILFYQELLFELSVVIATHIQRNYSYKVFLSFQCKLKRYLSCLERRIYSRSVGVCVLGERQLTLILQQYFAWCGQEQVTVLQRRMLYWRKI